MPLNLGLHAYHIGPRAVGSILTGLNYDAKSCSLAIVHCVGEVFVNSTLNHLLISQSTHLPLTSICCVGVVGIAYVY
jgi:hypothetical protein